MTTTSSTCAGIILGKADRTLVINVPPEELDQLINHLWGFEIAVSDLAAFNL
jgi:hypothetical protein